MGSTVSQIGMIVGTAIITGGLSLPASLGAGVFAKVAIGGAIIAGSMALAPKPKLRNGSLQQQAYQQQTANRSLMIKQPIISRSTVYGTNKKSGGILFMDTVNNNKELHIIVEIASHEVNSIAKVYFNDDELTLVSNGTDANGITRFRISSPSKYSGNSKFDITKKAVQIKLHTGSDTQLADADLVSASSNWTNEHRLQGIAYIYARLDYDADMFPNGIPNISAEIQGKKILDFRTGSTGFSSNSALCIYDYLSDTRLGLGIPLSSIDTTSFTTMANLCDENVSLSAGGTENRYECHGIVYSDIAPMEILDDMLSSCLGILSYSNGKFILKGGQFISPTISLDEDDFISGFKVNTKQSRRSLFNTVKGIFTSEETNWQPSDYPMVTSQTFVDNDGETIFADIDLPFTTSSTMAQRIAKASLFKNRQQMTLAGSMKLSAFKLEVGDTVNITNSRLGFTNKIFEVAEYQFNMSTESVSVDLVLKETASNVYDWNAEESVLTLDDTTLPSSATVNTPSLTVTDELRTFSETPITVLLATVQSNQGTTNEFEVQFRNVDLSEEFKSMGKSKGNVVEIVNVQDGANYEVRARAINAFNVHSSFVTVSHEVVGKTASPSDVSDFTTNVIGSLVDLRWTPVTDLDLSHYVIRHTSDTTNPTFSEGVILAKKVGKPANTITLPAMTGTYMIKAVDVLGIESENSTKSGVILNRINNDLNVVATSTQNPNFTGTKDKLLVVTRDSVNKLEIELGEFFDEATGNFDDATGNFDDGGDAVPRNQGTYDFPTIDLGDIYNSIVTFSTTHTRFDTESFFDSQPNNFDDREGLFDGNYEEQNDTNIEYLISTSTDNSTYTGFRTYVIGEYKARFIKLRVKLTTDSNTATPSVSVLSATVDMPDRSLAESDITSGTASSGKAVTFSPAFKELQGLGISAQSLATGDFYELTSKSATGFTIKFKNSSGSVVSRDFDYVAKGFGRVESS
tara:strand:+ start:12094 stop:15009 length:2916 start_codon:yes stop_codon:yes gene_type:complete